MLAVVLAVVAIVVPALALAAAVRRWIAPVPWPITGCGVALVIAFLGPGLLSPSHVPVPLDEVIRGYPYKGLFGPVSPRNPLTNDTVKQILPWMDEVRRQLAAGTLPIWNPYAFSGYPLLGNGQSAPFSPFFLVTLIVPLPKQIVAMAGLKLFAALLFTFVAARREGAGVVGAAIASVVFAFSVFQTVYLYYPMTAVTALLPAAVVAVQQCIDRQRPRSFVFTALIGAAVLAGGHPESAFHVAVAAALVLATELFVRRGAAARGVVMAAGGAAAAIALSAIAWLPVAEQALRSARMHEIRVSERQMTPPFPGRTALALFHPDVFGHPARGDWKGFGNYSMVAPNYPGAVALVLFAAALLSPGRRRASWFGAIAIAFFLAAMNWSSLGRLINAAPLFTETANDRLRIVSVFFAALAIAISLERIIARRWILLGIAALVAAIASWVGFRHVAESSAIAAWTPAVAITAFAVAAASRVSVRRLGVFAVVVSTIELFVLNVGFNALAHIRYYKPDLPILTRLDDALRATPGRFVGFDWTLLPNASVHYQIEDIRGHDPMASARYVEFFRLIEAADPHSDVKRIQNVHQPALDFLNVRYLMTEPGQQPAAPWQIIYQGIDGNLFENPNALPRFFAPEIAEPFDTTRPLIEQLRGISDFSQRVIASNVPHPIANSPGALQDLTIQQHSPTSYELRMTSSDPVFIASSVVAAPGWRITVAGNPLEIRRVNEAFLGFIAPAGTHDILISYRPRSVLVAGASTAGTLLALISAAPYARRCSRARPAYRRPRPRGRRR